MKIQALVKRKRRIRVGRGFSKMELKAVNLSVREALKLGIPIDPRRSTMHSENIETLKSFLKENIQVKKPTKPGATTPSVKVGKKKEGKEAKATADLTKIQGIGAIRAQQLKSIGIDSIEKLAKANPKEISKNLQVAEKRVAKWISNAKQILLNESTEETS
mgnify:CR=1 FL=1